MIAATLLVVLAGPAASAKPDGAEQDGAAESGVGSDGPSAANEAIDADVGPSPSDASDPGPSLPRHSLYYVNLLGMSTNPLGVVDEFRVGYRLRLFQRPGVLFQGTHMDLHAYTYATPAYVHVGPYFEIAPLAILQLSARYSFVGYFSTFGLVQSFPTATADYRPSELDRGAEAGENYATTGHVVVLSGRLQGKVGPVALRNELTAQWSSNRLNDGDTVFYEQTFDVLIPNRGWVFVNDLDLLYLTDFGLMVGARYTMTHAFYQSRHYLPEEETDNPNTPHHRLGPAVLFQFFDRPGARFNTPTVAMLAQWWIRNRWRTGIDMPQAVPYFALAFIFEGQLWPGPVAAKKPHKSRGRGSARRR